MRLSKEQNDLLKSLTTNYRTGNPIQPLGEYDFAEHYPTTHDMNIIQPPLNCPKWACIVLPCINHIPSMKLFKQIIPRDAEVRQGERWVCYDASSLNKGDIVRLSEGDVIPADVRLLSLGGDFVDDYDEGKSSGDGGDDSDKKETKKTKMEDFIIDSSNINGENKPQTISLKDDDTVDMVELFAGSIVLQGEAIAVVTKIGNQTLLGSMIRDGEWPPNPNSNGGKKKGYEKVIQEEEEVVWEKVAYCIFGSLLLLLVGIS